MTKIDFFLLFSVRWVNDKMYKLRPTYLQRMGETNWVARQYEEIYSCHLMCHVPPMGDYIFSNNFPLVPYPEVMPLYSADINGIHEPNTNTLGRLIDIGAVTGFDDCFSKNTVHEHITDDKDFHDRVLKFRYEVSDVCRLDLYRKCESGDSCHFRHKSEVRADWYIETRSGIKCCMCDDCYCSLQYKTVHWPTDQTEREIKQDRNPITLTIESQKRNKGPMSLFSICKKEVTKTKAWDLIVDTYIKENRDKETTNTLRNCFARQRGAFFPKKDLLPHLIMPYTSKEGYNPILTPRSSFFKASLEKAPEAHIKMAEQYYMAVEAIRGESPFLPAFDLYSSETQFTEDNNFISLHKGGFVDCWGEDFDPSHGHETWSEKWLHFYSRKNGYINQCCLHGCMMKDIFSKHIFALVTAEILNAEKLIKKFIADNDSETRGLPRDSLFYQSMNEYIMKLHQDFHKKVRPLHVFRHSCKRQMAPYKIRLPIGDRWLDIVEHVKYSGPPFSRPCDQWVFPDNYDLDSQESPECIFELHRQEKRKNDCLDEQWKLYVRPVLNYDVCGQFKDSVVVVCIEHWYKKEKLGQVSFSVKEWESMICNNTKDHTSNFKVPMNMPNSYIVIPAAIPKCPCHILPNCLTISHMNTIIHSRTSAVINRALNPYVKM